MVDDKLKTIGPILILAILFAWGLAPFLLHVCKMNVGYIVLLKGDSHTAERLFLSAKHWDSPSPSPYWGIGQSRRLRGDFALAKNGYANFLEAGGHREAMTHFFIGQCQMQQGNLAEAIREWRLAKVGYYFERAGYIARGKGDWETAARNFSLAYQIDPQRTWAASWQRIAEGRLAIARGDMALASQHFQKAVDWAQDNYDAYLALGVAHFNLKQFDTAEEALLNARKIRPTSFWPSLYLGRVQLQRHQCTEAIPWFKEAAGIDPDHAPTHVALARAYRECGDKIKAIDEFRKALQLNPQDIQTQKELDGLLR